MLLDVILILILVACWLSGYRKGLLLSLMGLLVVALCCLGATAARNAMTPRAVNWLEPKLESMILPGVESELRSRTEQVVERAGETGITVDGRFMSLRDLTDFLEQFGMDVDLEDAVADTASDALAPVAQAAARAIALAFAEKLAGAVIFFSVFLILYLVLHSCALAVNLVDRLPVIHTCNRIGGGLLNLAGCLLVMVVAAAVCRSAGLLPGDPCPVTGLLVGLSETLL